MATSPEVHPADAVCVTHEPYELVFKLSLPSELASSWDSNALKCQLDSWIEQNNASGLYRTACQVLGWDVDMERVERYKTANEKTLAELRAALEDAEAQYGDTEKRDANLAIANHYGTIGDLDQARARYEKILEEKALESTGKVNILLTLVRIGFFSKNQELVSESINRAEDQFKIGGDWETRNRMRVYKAIHLACHLRQFAQAAELLISGLATFTANELISFNHFVELTVLLSMCALPRQDILKKLVKSPEVIQVLNENEPLRTFFNSFNSCNYRDFFRSFGSATHIIRVDQFVSEHYRFYVRQIRLRAYQQYLRPFKSVSLAVMASEFGVPPDFMEDQLASFIPSGMLKATIDRVDGIINTVEEDQSDELYRRVLKTGDALTNELQMLSRVIDM